MTRKKMQKSPSLLKRVLKKTVAMSSISNQLSYGLQKFVFYLNEYCIHRFINLDLEIPSNITEFIEGINDAIGDSEKRKKFHIEESELDDIMFELTSSYMYLMRKGSDNIQVKLQRFNELFPYKDVTPDPPSISSTSLSPLSADTDEDQYNKNGASTSGTAVRNSPDTD